jgi:hypothetical protein
MVSGVIAYNDPVTGKVFYLLINQAIHIPHLDHHLLCPMQCHVNDVIVDNLQKNLAADPTDKTHALTIPDPYDPLQMVTLPLGLNGVFLFLNIWNLSLTITTRAILSAYT